VGNHDEKLGLRRISCANEFTMSDAAGTSPNPACNYIDTSCSQPNQASGTPDLSDPLVSSTLFSSLSLIFLLLVHNSTIVAKHNVKSSLSISLCQNHELTLSTAYTESSIHQVEYTPITAYTEYSIHPRLFVSPSFP